MFDAESAIGMRIVTIAREFESHAGAIALREAATLFAAAAGITTTQNISVVDVHGNPYGSKGTQSVPRVRCILELHIPDLPSEWEK